eukprot:3475269-Prymnesium_polylepis.1
MFVERTPRAQRPEHRTRRAAARLAAAQGRHFCRVLNDERACPFSVHAGHATRPATCIVLTLGFSVVSL